ncbi:MAG: hypothetical protein C5S49_05210 [Candidatus Methanogaster sp.]|nr:MAG: hypothetical protein C5S49_05210 [ANME-2 cluster archaeon]
MNNTKFAIMSTILACSGGSRGSYTYSLICINTIIEKLKQHYNIVVKRRWVFQCLRDLLDAGYISRQPRRGRNSDGSVWQKSSIIAITLRGARFLFGRRVLGAKQLIASIMQWLRNNIDRRFPPKKAIMNNIDDSERRRLVNLAEIVTKDFT